VPAQAHASHNLLGHRRRLQERLLPLSNLGQYLGDDRRNKSPVTESNQPGMVALSSIASLTMVTGCSARTEVSPAAVQEAYHSSRVV
jgi:hypothetical protein